MRGATTRVEGAGVSPIASNLPQSRPETLAAATTFPASRRSGMAITHSPVATSARRLKFARLTTQATGGGSNSIIVCHDIANTFACPRCAVVTSTTGPGSSNW